MKIARIAAALAAFALSGALANADPLAIKVKDVVVGSELGQPVLNLNLDESASTAFADFTRANVGRQIELRIDGKTMLTAVLRDPILSGKVQVSGQNRAEFTDIADRIKAGTAKVEVDVSAK
jgi:preprotein translocase subunit SecD